MISNMKHRLNRFLILLFGWAFLSAVNPTMARESDTNRVHSVSETPAEREARTVWWRDERYGMFIHWDMSSIAGTEISWSRKGSKPLDITGDPAGYVEDPESPTMLALHGGFYLIWCRLSKPELRLLLRQSVELQRPPAGGRTSRSCSGVVSG
jgi:hypothetical protein